MAGPAGLLQPFADVFKLFFKEELRPKAADAVLFYIAPCISALTAFLAFCGGARSARRRPFFGLLKSRCRSTSPT
jgi:formate hydrogenlyase subunit 4